MKFISIHLLTLIVSCLMLMGCDKKTEELPSHNPAVFAQGRYCTNYLKFECLPESRDPTILNGNEPLEEGRIFYEYDEKKFRTYALITGYEDPKKGEKVANYVLTPEDYKWMAKVVLKQWYKEMEAKMEEQYPGFWGETPRSVRHRWMRLCVAKGNKYGYGLEEEWFNEKGEKYDEERGLKDPSHDVLDFPIKKVVLDENGKPKVAEGAIREMQQWIELCGRIGLNFDRDPKWQYIVDFIKHPDSVSMGHAGEAVNYIDFTVYEKDYSRTGNRFTDWYLQDALHHLPYPNRPVPRLNNPSERQ